MAKPAAGSASAPRSGAPYHCPRRSRVPAPTAFLVTPPTGEPRASPLARFLCAHGAGAGMETPFLTAMAQLLAGRGIATHRFEFAYMGARRASSARKPPPRAERLIHEFLTAVAHMPTG